MKTLQSLQINRRVPAFDCPSTVLPILHAYNRDCQLLKNNAPKIPIGDSWRVREKGNLQSCLCLLLFLFPKSFQRITHPFVAVVQAAPLGAEVLPRPTSLVLLVAEITSLLAAVRTVGISFFLLRFRCCRIVFHMRLIPFLNRHVNRCVLF